jgi:hypothetical protein
MTDTEIQRTILKELRELRGSFETFAVDTGRRLDNLESQVSTLVPTSPRPVLVKVSKRRQSSGLP